MLRSLSAPVAFILVALLLPACTTPVTGSGDSGADVAELQKEIAGLKREIAILNRRLDALTSARKPQKQQSVTFAGNPMLGSKSAKIAMIEFSDYQCPFCKRFHEHTFEQIKRAYVDSGRMLYVYRDYPLPNHRQAPMAAVAANCAGKQGAYWAMQRALFGPGARLQKDFYLASARELKLNLARFERCLSDPNQMNEVMRDARYGSSLGIRGTPAFFIGRIEGEKIVDVSVVVGAQPYQAFSRAIDQALQRLK